ncbi:Inositol polyphosphate-related phosphatase domain and Endonuclease/exonuclease/phosphatase domain-containing protein [Strongyloides ratti]|uniref:Inositol polyphosphate-related phosphatase domain and Endonuclease/exonuclease/phosphatase domain-containing protein n=1 Tax=Strongyloides ratti TaxID=34506 RepID=A0A090LLK7_STRRB|nr:Inositol polyphosphate-related phosphatase domain and Endonuclease/exonuclease/phosphatase domain-containing protein [Strongyloides ratti]CEF68435.1 Inositol polyphosphate-related phosphatase domain and Endonuclease/exonuclease/phosphatase domain-containing protein [Strongyloides ratti]
MSEVITNCKICCFTYNVNLKLANKNNVEKLLGEFKNQLHEAHFVVFGFQEIALSEFSGATPISETWPYLIAQSLKNINLTLLHSTYLSINRIVIFTKKNILPLVEKIETRFHRFGLMGLSGHKGTLSVKITLSNNERLIFLSSHFIHDAKEYQTRINQYRDSIKCTFNDKKEKNVSIFWMGDFNWRLHSMDHYSISRELEKLRETEINDFVENNCQLKKAQKDGSAFEDFEEPSIFFMPTYKLKIGTNIYESTRVSSWCDRILYKGDNIQNLLYTSNTTINISDHLPVFGLFIKKFFIPLNIPNKYHQVFPIQFHNRLLWYSNTPLIVNFSFKNNFWNQYGSNFDWIGIFSSLLFMDNPICWVYLATCITNEIDSNTMSAELPGISKGSYKLVYFSSKLKCIKGISDFEINVL